ncbi:MAG: hypothetical protein R3F59_20400 [Myxococcota bacterium]
MAIIRRATLRTLAALTLAIGLMGPATALARPPEPAPVAETVPPAPGPGYAWVPGSWDWHPFRHEYSWEPGYWAVIEPPAPAVYGWWRPGFYRPPLVVRTGVVYRRPIIVRHPVVVHRR